MGVPRASSLSVPSLRFSSQVFFLGDIWERRPRPSVPMDDTIMPEAAELAGKKCVPLNNLLMFRVIILNSM